MAGSQAMNQGSALALPMAAPTLWIIWSHHLLYLIVPHHLLYINALYSVEKGVIPNHRPLSLDLQLPWQHVSSATSKSCANIRRFNIMLASAHSIVSTYSNRLPSAQHTWVTQTMLKWSCSCCMTAFVTPLRLCMAALRHAPIQHNIVINHGLILNVATNTRKHLHMQSFILTAI